MVLHMPFIFQVKHGRSKKAANIWIRLMVHHLKYPKQTAVTLSFKYRILPINHELFVFHQKNESLLKVLLRMKITTLAVS